MSYHLLWFVGWQCFWTCRFDTHTQNSASHYIRYCSQATSHSLKICLCVNVKTRSRKLVVIGGRQSGRPWLGPGLVRVVCTSPGLFRTIARTRFIPLHVIVREIQLSLQTFLKSNGRPSVVFGFIHSLMFID